VKVGETAPVNPRTVLCPRSPWCVLCRWSRGVDTARCALAIAPSIIFARFLRAQRALSPV